MARNAREWESQPRLPHSHFVDNVVYTDQGLFEEEQEKIFGRSWKLVCHESELGEKYDYRTSMVAGQPLVSMRGEDGRVRTFLNACPHRGALIVTAPSGNARNVTCMFHQWTFDTAGNCIGITRREGYEAQGVTKEDNSLREVRTEVHLGLVFVNLDDDGESLEEFLGGATDAVANILGATEMEVFHYHKVVLETNWKLWQLTNMELYHEYMHVFNRRTQMGNPDYFKRELKVYPQGHQTVGPFSPDYEVFAGEAHDTGMLPGLKPQEWRIADLFPDVMLNIRGTVARMDTQTPISATQTVVEYRGLGVKGESDELREMRMRHHNEIWGPFGRNVPEDNFAVEAQMTAMRHGASPFSIHAREEGGMGQDDITMRGFFETWSRRMGREAADPFAAPARAAE